MHDDEVAKLARMNVATLQRKMKHGFAAGELDLRRAEPYTLGGRRVWSRRRVEALLKI